MKRIKSEKGVITLVTLVTVLFMLSFLISSYILIANKVKTQKEMLSEIKTIYEPKSTMEEIYSSYFSNDEIIPIYTEEQLLAIGEDKQISINSKIYTFTNESSYVLKNDLKLSQEIGWIPVGSSESGFKGNFEGNGHIITITNEENEIEHIYSEANSYGGVCNLTINTIPEDAIVTLQINDEIINENTANVPYNTTITYSIMKEGYIEKSDTIKITKNTILKINLEENELEV